jgi:hypothetical protein
MRFPSVTTINLAIVRATLAASAIRARFFEHPLIFGTMLALGLGFIAGALVGFLNQSGPPKD